MAEKVIRVVLVEDDKEMREILRSTVERAPGIHVVRTFANAEDFIDALPAMSVDVVLMDINLPGKNGVECIREAKLLSPATQFLVLTVFENPAYIFQALCAGATGYLVKNDEQDELITCIQQIHAGGSPMSAAIARLVVNSFQQNVRGNILDAQLTDREKSVLDHLANGLMYKEIAAKATISTETVRTHVHNIYQKLQVSSRMEAIRKVYPNGPAN